MAIQCRGETPVHLRSRTYLQEDKSFPGHTRLRSRDFLTPLQRAKWASKESVEEMKQIDDEGSKSYRTAHPAKTREENVEAPHSQEDQTEHGRT